MSRKWYLVVILLAGALPLGVFGQTQQAPTDEQSTPARAEDTRQGNVTDQVQRMSRRLNLSQEQKDQITAILQDQATQAKAIRQDTSLTPQQKRGTLVQLRHSSRAQVEGLLTPEQVAIISRPRAGREMARMAERLNLTPDQKSKIKPIVEQGRKQVQAVRSDTSLDTQQKQEQVRKIRKATHTQIVALLTPEQHQELKQMRRRHGTRRRSEPSTVAPGSQSNSAPPASAETKTP